MAHKIIYDTDPGIDDAMALLFAQLSPAIDLVGITTVFGNARSLWTTSGLSLCTDRTASQLVRFNHRKGSVKVRDTVITTESILNVT